MLAHEDIPLDAVLALQQLGHTVEWMRMDAPGRSDRKVTARIEKTSSLFLTYDKELAERVYRFGLPAKCGLIAMSLPQPSPKEAARWVVTAIRSRNEWLGFYSIISPHQLRVYRLKK